MNGVTNWWLAAAEEWWRYVAHATWQSALLGLLILGLAWLLRRQSAPLRYGLLLVALLKFAVPPMWALPTGAFSLAEAPGPTALESRETLVAPARTQPAPPDVQAHQEPTQSVDIASSGTPADDRSTPSQSLEPSADARPVAADARMAQIEQVTPEREPHVETAVISKSAATEEPAASPERPASGLEPEPLVPLAATQTPEPSRPRSRLPFSALWKPGLLAVHAAGSVGILIWILASYSALLRLVKRAEHVTQGPLYVQLRTIAARMGVRRPIRLLVSKEGEAPAVFGFRRPTLLLPQAVTGRLSAKELAGVMAHELAHLRRHDMAFIWFENLLLLVWWFNPVLWLLIRASRRTREECCDDIVLATEVADHGDYCDSLVRAASTVARPSRSTAALGFADALHPLGKRLKRIMDRTLRRSVRLSLAGLLIVVGVALLVLPGLREAGAAQEPASGVRLAASESMAQGQAPAPSIPVPPELEQFSGEIVFQGAYIHRSRRREIDEPSELWLRQADDGSLAALARVPFMNATYVVHSDDNHRPVSYSTLREASGDRPGYRIALDIQDGQVLLTRRGVREDCDNKELPVPEGALFDPNTRPDPYLAANLLVRAFDVKEGESKECRVYDWDNSGEGLADYSVNIEHLGKEEIRVRAGTFMANHLVLVQSTDADTWFKKRTGHVTDFWVLDNGVIVRILRHREPYELELLSWQTPAELPGLLAPAESPATAASATPATTTAAKPAETQGGLRIRAFIDGVDIVKVRGSELWYEHQSWNLPGTYRDRTGKMLRNEPTTVNGQKWMPRWDGKVSERFKIMGVSLPRQTSEGISLTKVEGRGRVSITDNPRPDNDYTLSVLIDDGPNGGAAWYEFVLQWEQPAISLLDSMRPVAACRMTRAGGHVVLTAPRGDQSYIETKERFRPPFRVKTRAMTDSLNLRMYYGGKTGHLIFNWEWQGRREELRIAHPQTGALVAGVWPSNEKPKHNGAISPNEWHDIEWEIRRDSMRVTVDGEERFSGQVDCSACEGALGIGPAWGSTVSVQSFVVEPLRGEKPASASPAIPAPAATSVSAAASVAEGGLGPQGGVLRFDGRDDFIHFPPAKQLDLSQNLTISAWANVLPGGRDASILFRGDRRRGHDPYHLVVKGGKMMCTMDGGTGEHGGQVVVSHRVQPGWHHWAVTCDAEAGKLRLYQDGQQVSESSAPQPCTYGTSEMYNEIGAIDSGSWGGTWGFFKGDLDEVAVWNAPLSAEQIHEVFAKGAQTAEHGLVALWLFDEDGQNVLDSSPYDCTAPLGRTPEADASDPARVAAASVASRPIAPPIDVGSLRGDLVFEGTYAHSRGGKAYPGPGKLWLKKAEDGSLITVAHFGFLRVTDIAIGNTRGLMSSYRTFEHGPSGDTMSGVALEFAGDSATIKDLSNGAEQHIGEFSLSPGALFAQNNSPDSFCELNIVSRQFALRIAENKEVVLFDLDKTGKGIVEFKGTVEHAGIEEIEIPAGRFRADHAVLTLTTAADTGFPQKAGDVTHVWLLPNNTILRVLRESDSYDMVLTDYESASPLPRKLRDAPAAAGVEPIPTADALPGGLVFHGRYVHRSRGHEYDQPSTLWLKQQENGALSALSHLAFFKEIGLAVGDANHRPVYYAVTRVASDRYPAFEARLDFLEDKATQIRHWGEETDDKEFPIDDGALFALNSRPDPYAVINILVRRFALKEGESKEFTLCDWGNGPHGPGTFPTYQVRVEHKGKEEIAVRAGTFNANHLVLTQLTSADTWYKKRAGHVTDFWVLDNNVIVRIVRHREPYEVELLDYDAPAELPGQIARASAEGKTLEIVSAKYGAQDKWVDVTEQLKQRVRDNTLTLRASNDLAGDPIYGVRKELKVEYRLGEQTQTTTVQEGGTLRLPPGHGMTGSSGAETKGGPTTSSEATAVMGRVTDKEGDPIPNCPVDVRTYGGSDRFSAEVMTDDDGRFEARGMNPGKFWLRVRPKEHHGAYLIRDVGRGDNSGFDFSVDRAVRFQGRVVDTNGDPLAGVELELVVATWDVEPGERRQGPRPLPVGWDGNRTDDEGRFDCSSAAPGVYWLKVIQPQPSADRSAQQLAIEQPLVLEHGKDLLDHDVVVRPREDSVIAGRVVDGAGKPVKGVVADSFIPHDRHWWTRTGEDGGFKLIALDGIARDPLDVYFNHSGLAADSYKVVARGVSIGTHDLTLVVHEAGSIEGVAVKEDGVTPLTECELKIDHVMLRDCNAVALEPSAHGERPGTPGAFRITNVPAGTATLELKLGERRQWCEVEVLPGKTTQDVSVRLLPPCVLEGTITITDTRSPAAKCGIEVVRRNPDQGVGWFNTDEQGHYRIDTLPAGDYAVRPLHQRHGEWYRTFDVTLSHGETVRQDAAIGGTGVIKGTVRYPDRFMFARLILREAGLEKPPDPWADRPTVLDRALTCWILRRPGETYEMINVPPGTWEMVAYGYPTERCVSYEQRLPTKREVTVGEGETVQLDLTLGETS